MNSLGDAVAKLCAASIRGYINPDSDIGWPDTVGSDQWCTSPELISLYGTSVYDSLSAAAQKRLSFYEAINFFSINIHGEKSLIRGLARRLYGKSIDGVSRYLHHFLDEENKHMMYFAGFCMRYAGKVYPNRRM